MKKEIIIIGTAIILFLCIIIFKISFSDSSNSNEEIELNKEFAPNLVSNKNEYYHVDNILNKNHDSNINQNNNENNANNEKENFNYAKEYEKEEYNYEKSHNGKQELNYCWEKQEFNGTTEKLCIPKHYIIGVSKCGTNFLQNVLSSHPIVSKQLKKDLNFYNYDYKEGLEFYSNQFLSSSEHIRIDKSTAYFVDMKVPPLVAKTVPHAQLLVILRNPVDRALSNYYSFIRNPNIFISSMQFSYCKFKERSFEEYLQEEFDLLKRCNFFDEEWNPPSPPWNITAKKSPFDQSGCKLFPCNTCEECFPNDLPVISILNAGGMLMKSLYYPSLQFYLNYFPILEDFKENGNEEMFNRICDWMGIDRLNWEEYTDFSYDRDDYPPMQNITKEWLEEFYRIPIQRLNSLTHLNFTWY